MSEKASNARNNEIKWRSTMNKCLSELKMKSSSDVAAGKLDEALRIIGTEIDPSHSLVINIDGNTLDDEQKGTFANWGIIDASGNFSIPLRIPVRETTGTHGSGERQKFIESVRTMIVDEDSQGNPVIKINLFGNFTGLYHKLSDLLSIEINPNSITDIGIDQNTKWKEFLSNAAQIAITRHRWPDFVKQQVDNLSK
jgi:hypothetical protein